MTGKCASIAVQRQMTYVQSEWHLLALAAGPFMTRNVKHDENGENICHNECCAASCASAAVEPCRLSWP